MKLTVEQAEAVYRKYGLEVPIVYLIDYSVKTPTGSMMFSSGMRFDLSHIEPLKMAGKNEIEVVFSDKLFAKLINLFPEKFRIPAGRGTVVQIDRVLSELDDVNRLSKRKRYLISSTEIYSKESTGRLKPVVQFGEKLDYQKWNQLKMYISRNTVIEYRWSENGIIVFVILDPNEPDYASKFLRFSDMIAMLVEDREDVSVSIAPDFIGSYDVISVNNPDELLITYMKTEARLIIIGDQLTDRYKVALAKVKAYDRFARMVLIPSVDKSNPDRFRALVKRAYNSFPWRK